MPDAPCPMRSFLFYFISVSLIFLFSLILLRRSLIFFLSVSVSSPRRTADCYFVRDDERNKWQQVEWNGRRNRFLLDCFVFTVLNYVSLAKCERQ